MTSPSLPPPITGHYNPQRRMVQTVSNGVGYHTQLAADIPVHPTRESLAYALKLLESGNPTCPEPPGVSPPDAPREANPEKAWEAVTEAGRIIDTVIAMQDTDPVSRTYGIWPWFAEEPLDQMAPPDWNWADFCGAILSEALIEHSVVLGPARAQACATALAHAGRSIFRRNVGPHYTNIAIMGAAVTLLAGQINEEAWLVAYGRRRLAALEAHTTHHGNFTEYSSPTYTIVAIKELERILRWVHDAQAWAIAERLRRQAWRLIADAYHPATGQWCGPCSRAYSDRLKPATVQFLADRVGTALRHVKDSGDIDRVEPRPIDRRYACPEQWVACFTHPVREPRQTPLVIDRDPTGDAERTGMIWQSSRVCLGSVSHETLWTQRRPLLGYWATEQDAAVTLRARVFKDGKDFASASLCCVQDGPRVLAFAGLLVGQGDWHIHLDTPADGMFRMCDLRVVIELAGRGVTGSTTGADRFCLSAGAIAADVVIGGGAFDGQPMTWSLTMADGVARVEGAWYTGPPRDITIAGLEATWSVFGLSLREAEEAPASGAFSVTLDRGAVSADWAGLALRKPVKPTRLAALRVVGSSREAGTPL